MGTLRAKTIEPATGSTLTLGASGDTVTVSSDSIKVNTFKRFLCLKVIHAQSLNVSIQFLFCHDVSLLS